MVVYETVGGGPYIWQERGPATMVRTKRQKPEKLGNEKNNLNGGPGPPYTGLKGGEKKGCQTQKKGGERYPKEGKGGGRDGRTGEGKERQVRGNEKVAQSGAHLNQRARKKCRNTLAKI